MKKERHYNRRDFLRMTALASAGAVLASCGAPTGNQPGNAAPTSTPGKVTLEFMNWWGMEREDLLNGNIAAFEKDHSNIHVVDVLQPWDNRGERAATAIASKNPPSVLMAIRTETYKYAKAGLIIPIDDYIKASGLAVDNIFYASDLNNQRWGGKLWTLPLPGDSASNSLYLYRKDVFQQAGLDPENPPKTWTEMYNACKATTTLEGNVIKKFGANVVQNSAGSGYDFPAWLHCNNGKYCSEDGKKLLFNSPEGVETLDFMVNLTNDIYGGDVNQKDYFANVKDENAYFFQGDQAMVFAGTWIFGAFLTAAPDIWKDPKKWGVAQRPYNDKNPSASSHGATGLEWAWGYVIPKSLPKEMQDAAYQWVEWWTTQNNPKEEGGCKFLYAQSQVSALKKCNEDPAWKDLNPYWDVVVKASQSDLSVPVTPVQDQITAALVQGIEQVLYGKIKSKEALDQAAQKGQAILDKFWAA